MELRHLYAFMPCTLASSTLLCPTRLLANQTKLLFASSNQPVNFLHIKSRRLGIFQGDLEIARSHAAHNTCTALLKFVSPQPSVWGLSYTQIKTIVIYKTCTALTQIYVTLDQRCTNHRRQAPVTTKVA